MLTSKQIAFLLCVLWSLLAAVVSRPDGGETHPLPGPGLSYGGIPYGSVSGNVAEYFRRPGPSIVRRVNFAPNDIDYTPIEQWLRR
ncbi:uncharacterized protein LOC113236756 [Hyposmocoma kahamanoa]|uniref:uncharacterized protein LOC113236756 n=1 Tax=Hyposmocoma kahamanoa TaxID=1477025 RepID=UPI000E6D7842|nr:uncharacterized protein LOC113236756 [Hyposmocoma kahamanoa]